MPFFSKFFEYFLCLCHIPGIVLGTGDTCTLPKNPTKSYRKLGPTGLPIFKKRKGGRKERRGCSTVEYVQIRAQEAWVYFELSSCVTLGKALDLPLPQFPHL